MKDQLQKDRQSLANSQYRAFMKTFAKYLADPLAKEWAEKQSQHGAPSFTGQIDPTDSRISGYSFSYTRHVHKLLVVSFNLTFQAGIREMCRTEIICSYSLADNEKTLREHPDHAACFPLEEEDVLEHDDPYLWQVWQTAEKMNVHGIQCVRKSDLSTRGKKNMDEMAECAAGLINPMISIAIGARNFINKKK